MRSRMWEKKKLTCGYEEQEEKKKENQRGEAA
jgi:hypothetical protein